LEPRLPAGYDYRFEFGQGFHSVAHGDAMQRYAA
jgi:hypothetical protein